MRPIQLALALLAANFIAPPAHAQPAAAPLPEPCSPAVLGPGQEAVISALLTVAPMAGVMPVRTGDMNVSASTIDVTYHLGVGHDGQRVRYRLDRSGHEGNGREDVELLSGPLRLRRLGPCTGDADAGGPLCSERNGRAALAALHLQLRSRLLDRGGGLKWRCPGASSPSAADRSGAGARLGAIHATLLRDRSAAGPELDALLLELPKRELRAQERLEVAILSRELGRAEEVRLWLTATVAAPPSPDLVEVQARAVAMAALGQQVGATALVAECATATPPCSVAAIATALERLDRSRLAAKLVDDAWPANGEVPVELFRTRIRLAESADAQDKSATAQKWLKSALSAWPADPALRQQAAVIAANGGDLAAALEHATVLYRLAPDNPATFELLAGWFRRMSEAGAAEGQTEALRANITALVSRLETPEASPLDRFQGGLAALHAGNPGRAIELLQAARGAHPNEVQVVVNLALAQHRLGALDKAQALADEAVKLGPTHPEAHFVLAQVRLSRDRPGAIASLRRHLELSRLDPGHTGAMDKRIESDLGKLQAGELPAGWQLPEPQSAGMGGSAVSTGGRANAPANEPLQLPAPPGALAILAAFAALGALAWWWRRRG